MKRTQAKRRPATHREQADEHAATELVMYIENTSDLSPDGPRGQGRSVLLNALRKWRKGTYDPEQAVTLFGHLAEAGAKRYAKEFGSSEKEWSTMFNPATRHEAARQLEASFRNSVQNREYDHIDTRIGIAQSDRTVMNARRETRLDKLRASLPPGYSVYTYSPGDGITRYRFFKNAPKSQDYFGPDSGIYTALGYKEAETFAEGLAHEFDPRGASYRRANEARRRKKPPERPAARDSRERKHSMTYGTMPSFEDFERDIHTRIDPEYDRPYWPPGTTFPMELVGSHEQELAYNYGLEPFESERQRTGRNSRAQGFRGNESDIYNFVVFLIEEWNNGDEEAGDLASSIMYTLGYEWI